MGKSAGEELLGIGLGILGGLALIEIIKSLTDKKCPYCHNYNESNLQFCKYCGGKLQ